MRRSNFGRTRFTRAVPQQPQVMINRPTVMPAQDTSNQALPVVDTDPFFSISVRTAGAENAERVILFDGGAGYQLHNSVTSGPNVAIEGVTAPYDFMMNDVVHNASFVNLIKMQVIPLDGGVAPEIALLQYNRPISVFTSSKGSAPRLMRTIHPTMGVNEQQYLLQLNTFEVNLLIDNRISLVYDQEPETNIVWSFYQSAEVGRKQ